MDKFKDIRPLYDSEVSDAIEVLSNEPMFIELIRFVRPDDTDEQIRYYLKTINTIKQFTEEISFIAALKLLEKTSEKIFFEGIKNLDKKENYLFMSNHRDIILDAIILNKYLIDSDFDICQAAAGSNLLENDKIFLFARLLENFCVMRNSSPKEMLQNSKLLSEYIYHKIINDKKSIWISQKEGRSKDGNDKTQPAVLKMIALNKGKNESLVEYFCKLKIVPIAISYEYDPTDFLKLPQLIAQSNNRDYVKSKNEDTENIVKGVIGQKKKIKLTLGKPLEYETLKIIEQETNINNQLVILAKIIDERIYRQYKIWSTNFIAFDILYRTDLFKDKYTVEDRNLFKKRLKIRISSIEQENKVEAELKILQMYSNPILNSPEYKELVMI